MNSFDTYFMYCDQGIHLQIIVNTSLRGMPCGSDTSGMKKFRNKIDICFTLIFNQYLKDTSYCYLGDTRM